MPWASRAASAVAKAVSRRPSGTASSRAGWFGSANGGTLYLDEIADLPLPFAAVVLGMGEDGHTASFYPGGDNLAASVVDQTVKHPLAARTGGLTESHIAHGRDRQVIGFAPFAKVSAFGPQRARDHLMQDDTGLEHFILECHRLPLYLYVMPAWCRYACYRYYLPSTASEK